MNPRTLAGIRRLGIVTLTLTLAVAVAGCQRPTPRAPTAGGSARWAFGIAQPVITAFAPDAELRMILGATVSLDGRLPANTGAWSFVAWSPTRSTIQVTVRFDGTTYTSQRMDPAPGPGIQRPLPASWADSTQVFEATYGKRNPAAQIANLVGLNVASYPQAPHKAVWAINFDVPPNQLVTVDGTYIGPE